MPDELTPSPTATESVGGGSPAPAGSAGQAGHGPDPSAGGYVLPQKWKGKSVEDIARAHEEVERRFGQQGQELGQYREYSQRAGAVLSQWEPLLRQFNYDPQRLVAALEQRAQDARAQGDRGGARQAQAAAQQAFHELIDPRQQQEWIESHVSGRLTPLQQEFQKGLQTLRQEGQQYIGQAVDLALKVMELKLANPKLSVQALLGRAVKIAGNEYNPLDWAARIEGAPSEQDQRARIEQEVRAQIAKEQQHSTLTTSVGAGGAPRQALRPPPQAEANRPVAPKRFSMAAAKERFVQKMNSMGPG